MTIGLVIVALPELSHVLVDLSHHFLEIGLLWQGAALAVLAGLSITLITRMHVGTDDTGPVLVTSVTGAFILTGASLFHSVFDSIIFFGAIHSGAEGIGYLNWLGWICWVIPVNILGGIVFATGPRLVRSLEVCDDDNTADTTSAS